MVRHLNSRIRTVSRHLDRLGQLDSTMPCRLNQNAIGECAQFSRVVTPSQSRYFLECTVTKMGPYQSHAFVQLLIQSCTTRFFYKLYALGAEFRAIWKIACDNNYIKCDACMWSKVQTGKKGGQEGTKEGKEEKKLSVFEMCNLHTSNSISLRDQSLGCHYVTIIKLKGYFTNHPISYMECYY